MNRLILYPLAFGFLLACAPERNEDQDAAILERSAAWFDGTRGQPRAGGAPDP